MVRSASQKAHSTVRGQDVGVPSLIAALRLFKPFCFCSRTPHEPFDIAELASLVQRLISTRCRSSHCALLRRRHVEGAASLFY
jgi:hypothetical protein